MVKEVFRASHKVVGIKRPALERNCDAELVLFVPLPPQRYEIKLLLSLDIVQCGPRERAQGWRLIEVSIEATEHPVHFRDSKRCANTRTGGIFHLSSEKVFLAQPAVERQP